MLITTKIFSITALLTLFNLLSSGYSFTFSTLESLFSLSFPKTFSAKDIQATQTCAHLFDEINVPICDQSLTGKNNQSKITLLIELCRLCENFPTNSLAPNNLIEMVSDFDNVDGYSRSVVCFLKSVEEALKNFTNFTDFSLFGNEIKPLATLDDYDIIRKKPILFNY